MKRWKQIAAAIAALAIAAAGFKFWLNAHDKAVLEAERSRVRLEQLAADNKALSKQVQDLKAENERIRQETAAEVQAILSARAEALTPAQQVAYIASNSPLHPQLSTTAPELVFPNTDAPIIADILAERKVLTARLAGCEQEKANLETIVADREKQLANKDEEIKLVKKSKNASKGQKVKSFGAGFASGAVAVVLAIAFLL